MPPIRSELGWSTADRIVVRGKSLPDEILGHMSLGEFTFFELTGTTPLITGAIIDSIATMKLVMFIEEKYGIALEPYEVDKENLDTIDRIVRLIKSKQPPVPQ